MKKNKILWTFIVITLSISAVHGARFVFGPRGKVYLDQRIVRRSMGNPSAPLWIVEYMDYQCGACRLAFFEIESYLKEYPSQIYLQVRFHPLKGHLHGLRSALYSECAMRQNKFWEFHRLLFENQKEWENLILVDDQFHNYARHADLDLKALDACVDDPATAETLIKENQDSIKLGVASTPTFFVNGKMIAGIIDITAELKKLFPKPILKDENEIGGTH